MTDGLFTQNRLKSTVVMSVTTVVMSVTNGRLESSIVWSRENSTRWWSRLLKFAPTIKLASTIKEQFRKETVLNVAYEGEIFRIKLTSTFRIPKFAPTIKFTSTSELTSTVKSESIIKSESITKFEVNNHFPHVVSTEWFHRFWFSE